MGHTYGQTDKRTNGRTMTQTDGLTKPLIQITNSPTGSNRINFDLN